MNQQILPLHYQFHTRKKPFFLKLLSLLCLVALFSVGGVKVCGRKATNLNKTLSISGLTRNISSYLLKVILVLLLAVSGLNGWGQTATWGGTTSGTFYTTTNWSGTTTNTYAGSKTLTTNTDIGAIATGSSNSSSIGINMNFSGNTHYMGAFSISGASSAAILISNSSGTFTTSPVMNLNGTSVNSISNVIIRNSSAGLFTISNGGSAALGILLGNSTDNIINIDGTGGVTITGVISGSSNKLTKGGSGTGVLTLSSTANTYSGSTTITTGELRFNPSATTATFASPIVLNGGTLATTSITTNTTFTSSSTLNLANSSTLALGSNVHSLKFAASNAVSWTAAKNITISGWAGTAGSSGTAGKIFVGSTAAGLTTGQLAQISFSGYTNGTSILSTGEVVPATSITLNTITLPGTLSNSYGTVSTSVSFTASGSNLTSSITATPQSGYEVSTTSSSSGFQNTAINLISNGTTVYVRNAATKVAGTTNGVTAVVLSSTGATNANVTTSASSNIISPAALTITGLTANSKIYDANTTVSVTGTTTFTGLQNGESSSVIDAISFAFPDANVGTNKTLTRSGSYTVPSANYSIIQPTLTANITVAALSITATAQSKNFGTTSVTTGATSFTTSGLLGTDALNTVSLGYSGSPTGNLATASAGDYNITPSGANFTIGFSTNYNITYNIGVLTINAIVPSAPTIGTATSGNTQATVNFTAPTSNGGSAITSYTATSSPGGFTGTVNQAGSGFITVYGLSNGTAYTFTVTATNDIGISVVSSATNSVTPSFYCVPSGSTTSTSYFSSFSTSGGITNISNITGYSTGGYADYTSQFVSQYAGNNVSFSAIIVRVNGQVGVGVWVDWNNDGDFVDGGENVYNTNGNFISSNPSNISFSVPSGQAIRSYRMRIIVDYNSATPVPCISGTVNAGEAEDYTFTVLASTVPPAPTAVVATPVVGQASVTFTAPTNNGGATIISYTVTASGGLTGTGSTSPIVVSGLTGGTAYTFTVTATNSNGTSVASSPSSSVVIPLSAPVATAASPIAVTSFTANWGVVSGITGYKLDVSTNSNFFVTTTPVSSDFEANLFTGWSNTTNWVITNASPITGTYSLRINAASSQQTNYIYTQPTTYDVTNSTTTWRFNIKTNYAPSANNKAFFYLMSNQTNLAGTSSNGYVVGFNFSGTDDLIKLWKSTAGVVDGSPLLASTQAVVSGTIYGIEVTRTSTGVWTLKYKSGGGFTSMTTVSGSATDATYTNSSYSGLVSFTTSSNAQDLRFDDFSINNAISTLLASYTDLDVASTSHSVTGLSANTNYYYRIRAINAITTSSNSNTISVSTKAIGTADYRSKAAGNFSSVANWEYNNTGSTYIDATQLPLSTNIVSIIHAITLDQDYTVASGKTFTISTGGSLTVSSTSSLNIAGTANFGGQSVTLLSTNEFNGGAIGAITGTLTNATNVSIQRFTQAQRGYRTLGNPLTNAQPLTQLTDNFQITGLTAQADSSATAGLYGITTGNPSSFTYNPLAISPSNPLTPITSATALSWDIGKGLYVFVRGNGHEGSSNSYTGGTDAGFNITRPAGISAFAIDVNGTINQGTKNIVVDYSATAGGNNYNLIANPYPSPINLQSVVMLSDASTLASNYGFVYTYNPKQGAGSTTVTAGGFTTTSTSGNPSIIIPTMGAFYVLANATKTISFQESAKTTTAPSLGLFGTGNTNPRFRLNISAGSVSYDDVQIGYNNTSSAQSGDFYDAYKLANAALDFYSLSSDLKNLAIDYRRTGSTHIIPLGIKTSVVNTYSISLIELTDLPNTQLVLRDKLLNTETPLVAVGDSYSFSITADAATKGNNRFEISLLGTTVLPTRLTSFTAQLQTNNNVSVNWATVSEVNADYYQVQLSTNGNSFTSIGKVAAKGAGSYTYNDDLSFITPQPSTVYYRLQMVDKDGSVAYSKVASVQLATANKALSIYPNPVQATLFAQVTATKAGKVTIVVTDMQGKQLSSQTAAVNAGTTALSIDANGLAAGTYVLVVTDSDGEQQKQQFVKQ